ncbi:hypothetical protein NQZ68_016379 [Dissostichus eleginoides]|nr:hypothetical protein NQZ68_016379 [Dissostichus eleginoides]
MGTVGQSNMEQSELITSKNKGEDALVKGEVSTGCILEVYLALKDKGIPAKLHSANHRTHFHTGKVLSAMCVCVCRLPEVGDLLLSMSMDCWLSESSVRPVAANGSQEEER